MVENGSRGTKLITEVAQKTWKNGGLRSFYRGLPLAMVGIFPYSAIDLGTFEYLKRSYVKKHAKKAGCREEDVRLPVWTTLGIGAVSGSVGASAVYPINLLRTRLQAQGTSHHPQTYTGMWDVTMKTYKAEGIRGMYRGLVPNMMKVIPAVSIVSSPSWWSECVVLTTLQSYVVYEQLKSAMRLK
jgi:solute carrier family 25 phosphate transporter 23/24/25/41